MTSPDEASRTMLDAWLDGRLSGDERARFEARLGAEADLAAELERQRAIDASLRRTFATPEPDVAALLELAGVTRPEPRRGRFVLRSFLGLLAAAAAVVAFVRLAATPEREPASATEPLDVARATPPVGAGRDADALESPNLVRLYLDAAGQEGQSQCTGPSDLSEVARELSSRYGSRLSLTPEASGVLHGPFDSQEWPSGTVLTSYPDGPSGQPVVLVAEEEAQLACCLDVSLPQPCGLQLFTWQVGSLRLTEITPHGEPRLIGCFEPGL